MLKSSSCVYSDAYIFVNGTITIQEKEQMMIQGEQTKEIKHNI